MHDQRFKLMRHISSFIEAHHDITALQVCIYYIVYMGTFKRENLFVLSNVSFVQCQPERDGYHLFTKPFLFSFLVIYIRI